MPITPQFPAGDPRWVYDDPSGVPDHPAPVVPSVPPLRKEA